MSNKITVDGNYAASYIAHAVSDVAVIYPITPSTPMGENADEWAAAGKKNIFGHTLKMSEMQSEAGAVGAVHGSLSAGALTTTFTASQGLLLMIPNMYKIAGELLPTVFHVSARALATHALSIFGDHSDVMACRQTGFAMLASNSVQEVMDLALVAHIATLKANVPFIHFFDGFRTSHEIQKIESISYEDIEKAMPKKEIKAFRKRALNPENPIQKGTTQNPDIYFQGREASNPYYLKVPEIVEEAMAKVGKITGRNYSLFDYYGDPEAEKVIVIMGSGATAVEETIDYLRNKGEKVGVIKVRLYRPFAVDKFVEAIPKTCKYIAVMDRTKEPGSLGEPLYLDVASALVEKGMSNDIKVLGGRYGLGSKEFNSTMIKAIYDNCKDNGKNHFTIGIDDDVTKTSLTLGKKIDTSPKDAVRCKFYGLGSDGTVGANKNSIKIIGEHTDKYAQGYFSYDSKKSGGLTVSHLRFGDTPIKSSYLIDTADFIACHNQSYVTKYDMVSDIKKGGVFLLNTNSSIEDLDKTLPAKMKNDIAKNNIQFYIIDALKIASSVGLGNRISTVMQAAFFKLADVIPYKDADKYMKEMVVKTFSRKGEKIVNSNIAAIDNAISGLQKVDYPKKEWAKTKKGAKPIKIKVPAYYKAFVEPIIANEGDTLPVSKLSADGSVPLGTSQYEKRGAAPFVPKWDMDKCIQCNQCSMVCPHAAIRPVLQKEENLKDAPETFKVKDANGFKGYKYRIQVSPYDCMGCSVCVNTCPAKEKALKFVPFEQMKVEESDNWDYTAKLPETDAEIRVDTPRGSQFKKPLFEFSGACAGCGETPYVKLATQLFGDRMVIASATGCSSIYGASEPTCPYTTNSQGDGPAWANSLFENNAEFGYGIHLAYTTQRNELKNIIEKLVQTNIQDEYKELFTAWLDTFKKADENKTISNKIKAELAQMKKSAPNKEIKDLISEVQDYQSALIKKSIWMFGGDGWAYDIGYGGLDHVLAQGEDVNILVLDTEVYSNTGGQASKASPIGAVAKFTADGKKINKKDLGKMAMSYGYVYVAQVAMGANMSQLVKAFKEAEAYDGPSIIIAYAPCINHGIKMAQSQNVQKEAVNTGYWNLYRYNPALKDEGKNPFTLDSKRIDQENYIDYLMSQNRYAQLKKKNPEVADVLFEKNKEFAKQKFDELTALANRTTTEE